MKKCIWCSKSEPKVTFNKLAHSIPQSIGGINTYENECDDCNEYFGNANNKTPSIDMIIKETFNISRHRFLNDESNIGKGKTLKKFTSYYFDVSFKKNKIDIKGAYKFHSPFQEKISRQLKRGIYRIYLSELERQNKGIGHEERFDFIREFVRYDFGDLPVFYFDRTKPIIPISV